MTNAQLSRREFTVLSAATAGALLAGGAGQASADVSPDGTLTDRYAFLLDHVEPGFSVPTLVRFDDDSGFDVLADLDVEFRTHGDRLAAHARLTPGQAETVAAADSAGRLEYSPGSNPFWRLGAYDDGVFPAPEDSVDYIAFEEALAGLEYLERGHGDRLNVEFVGEGHGHENVAEGALDPQDVWVVELADELDSEAAADRETVVFEMGIHGDERAGVEAGLRFVEAVLTGERPAVAELLSEVRLVFASLNPDGWVVRERLYEDPVDPPDFRRFNGADRDLNRQHPTAGWIPPDRVPGEPLGATLDDDSARVGTDSPADDVPERVATEVPEVLALVEHLRGYESVEYLVDFHGMYGHTNAVLALESGGGTPDDRADEDLLSRAIATRLQDAVGPLEDWADTFDRAVEDTGEQVGCDLDILCQKPVELFGHGTAFDTIDYTVSGALDSWADTPESVGGLDATSVTLEVVFSNSLPEDMAKRFIPDLVAFQTEAYGAVCAATAEHAVDDIEVAVGTGGRSTAYLDSEALTRRASDLPHVDGEGIAAGGVAGSSTLAGGRHGSGGGIDSTPGVDSNSALRVDSRQFAPRDTVVSAVEVSEGTHTLTVEVRTVPDRVLEAQLRDSDGNTVRQTDGSAGRDGLGRAALTAVDPDAGEWTLEARVRGSPAPVEVRTTRLQADGVPDPRETLGYDQRDYEVTALAALETLDQFADAPIEAVTADAIRAEGLLVGDEPAYDNLVVPHTHDVDEVIQEALAAYVEAGGNLVVTDSGLELAGALDVAGLDAVDSDDVTRNELTAAEYPGLDGSHPLVSDRRTFDEESWVDRREPWTHPPLGYARDEVPMYGIDADTLAAADATIAAAVDGRARLATVPVDAERIGVHLLGSLLPPAAQHNLHPFGLVDHSLTSLGYLLLCNALGYRLALSRNGRQVATLGSVVDVDPVNGRAGHGVDNGDGGGDGDGDGSDENGDGTDLGDEERGGVDDDGTGFGIAAGVAGAGGLGYLLSRYIGKPGSGNE